MTLPTAAEWEALFAPLWKAMPRLGPPLAWRLQLTTLLPADWPDPTGLVLFAYGTAFDPRIIDGLRISRPLAVGHLSADGPPRVEGLEATVEAVSDQGIRPLRGGEREIFQTAEAAQAELAQFPAQLSPLAHAYYRYWLSISGAIAHQLPTPQRRFFAALGAPGFAPAP